MQPETPSPLSMEGLTLATEDVDLWQIPLRLSEAVLAELQATLSVREIARADRFRFGVHRDRFVAARGCLRSILATYLDFRPAEVVFAYNPHGKPSLGAEMDARGLRFNLSHSHELGLIAVTFGREVGVDVEYLRPRSDLLSLARRFFSPREADALASLPTDLQTEAFHAGWTRKEAFVKAKGQGLTLGLDQFEVSLAPGEPAALLATRWDPAEAGRWSLRALTPAPGYLGALAVEGHGWRLRHRQWLPAISGQCTGR